MIQDPDTRAFLTLLKAGLWEEEPRLPEYKSIDYSAIMKMAEEQSVVGLITAGLEQVKEVEVPYEWKLQFIGNTIQIEQRNNAMDGFLAELIEYLRRNGVYAILVKGQGLAQCYQRPRWRIAGDVDLLLNEDNYLKAQSLLSTLSSHTSEENPYNKHIALTIDSWSVELHGTLRGLLKKSIDDVIDDVQIDIFHEGYVRSWMNERTQVFLPGADQDVFLVFAHILQHFFKGGIGLRHICDWCRLLWTYRDALNYGLLVTRIRKSGLLTEWKSFASLAVDYLGMPAEAMPLYSPSKHWSRQANRIMYYIIKTGHNRDASYYSRYPYFTRKAVSFFRRTKDGLKHFYIFPLDTCIVWLNMIVNGLKIAMKGK